MQRVLPADRLEQFYTDTATSDQVRYFHALVPRSANPVVVDVGGGHGFFARALQSLIGGSVRVIDSDPVSIAGCTANHVRGVLGDALHPPVDGDEDVACFNLILHHLIGASEAKTRELQTRALQAWHGKAEYVFVTEYVYDGPFNLPGRLIYWITRSRLLSIPARVAGWFSPRLKANTLGTGVRFRSRREWLDLFDAAGFNVVRSAKGREERVMPAHRLLCITHIRRDSFVLRQSS